jgi:hypothetical protein
MLEQRQVYLEQRLKHDEAAIVNLQTLFTALSSIIKDYNQRLLEIETHPTHQEI